MSDYLLDMRTGGAGRRWHAAFELSKKLANMRGLAHPGDAADAADSAGTKVSAAGPDQGFVTSLLELYEKSKHDDPRMRQYLALCLGYVQGSGVREALMASLADQDPQVRFYAVWSLAVKKDTQAVPRLVEMLKDEDASLKKVVVYALGALGDPRAIPELKGQLNETQPDIRWNAALALARLGDASGAATLAQMLDRSSLRDVPGIDDGQREQVMINAIRAAVLLKDSSLMEKISALAKQDTDLKVRQAALEALREKH